MSLLVTDPLKIGPAQLVSTNVVDDALPPWNPATTYALAARVIKNNAIWESAQSNNTGNDPETAGASLWLYVSPTNTWRAFDNSHNTHTSRKGGFYFELKLGFAISAVHITDMVDCNTVRVRLIDPVAGTVYDTGQLAVGSVITRASWWEWLFGQREEAD